MAEPAEHRGVLAGHERERGLVGEFIGSEKGLGNLMLSVQATLDTAAMFMAVTLITVIGILLYASVYLMEKWLVVRDARVE